MRIFFAHGGGEAFARWREEQGQTLQDWATWAAIAEEHGGDWHTWPEELRRPRGPELAALRRAARRRRRLPRLAAVGAGPAVHRRDRRHDRDPGPADRRRRRRRRRLGLAGRARRGRQRRRAAGRVQLAGPGLGLAAADPVAAARRRLRAVHPVDPRHDRRRRRPADRPRHGAVPAVVGAGRRLGRPTAPTSATRPRTCSTSSRWRATARRRSSSARTSARSRTASARPWPSTGSSPTGCCGSRTTTPPSGRPRRWPRSPPTTCRRSPGCGPAPDVEEQREHGTGTDEELERGRTSLLEHLPGLPDGAPVGAGGRAGAPRCWPRRRRCCCRPPWTTPSASSAGRTCPGTTDRPNWSLPAAGAGRGPARPPAGADGGPHPGRRGLRRAATDPPTARVPVSIEHVFDRRATLLGGRRHDSGTRRALPRRAGGGLRRPPRAGAAAAPAARRTPPPATAARAGTAGCATRPSRPAPGPACWSSGGSAAAPGRAGSPTR